MVTTKIRTRNVLTSLLVVKEKKWYSALAACQNWIALHMRKSLAVIASPFAKKARKRMMKVNV